MWVPSKAVTMAVREKGLEIDVLEKRIFCLERRILTSEKDVQSLEGSSVSIDDLLFCGA